MFRTTHWSAVLAASQGQMPGAEEALGQLCTQYWYPLYAYIRRRGYGPHDAEDLTQEFFAQLLEKQFLEGITQEGGKFRSFLLTALKRFLGHARERANAQKRGGGRVLLSLDGAAEAQYQLEPADNLTPERLFERRWAFLMLDKVMRRLRSDYQRGGKDQLFERLQPLLEGRSGLLSYTELGRELGLSESALKVAVHRMRKRYRELLRDEIAMTVGSTGEVESEMRHLISVSIAFGYSFRE